MLRNDLVADLFTQYFNEAGKDFNKVFEIYDSATDYKIVKPLSIVGILSETGGSVKPVMNYVNTTCNYEIGLLYSVEAGFGEIKKMNEIIENVIKALNGVPLQLSGGQALITFNQQHTGDYEINRPRIGKSVIPKLTFKVAYSQKQDGLRYEMALIDTPFDMTTQDTRYFNSQSEQQTYYLNKVAESGVPFCEMMAPNVNSLTLQQQVYINDLRYYPSNTTKVKDLNEILMKNYAIIRAMDGDTAVAYYYYWVQNANVGDNNQALLDLKMDTIQTWHFDPDIVYSDCMIHKAHLNRWIDNGDGTVSFDGTVNSKLFEREDIQNVAKRLTKRTRVNLYNTGDEVLDDWLNTNILGYIYIYVDGDHNFTISNVGETTSKTRKFPPLFQKVKGSTETSGSNSIYNPTPLLILPIYMSSNSIKIRYNNIDYSIEQYLSLEFFMIPEDNSEAYIYSIKFSNYPPFQFYNSNYQIENGNLIINGTLNSSGSSVNGITLLSFWGLDMYKIYTGEDSLFYGIWNLRFNNTTEIISKNYTLLNQFTFNKTSIIGSNKDSKYNPKLLSEDYKELIVSDQTENGFIYDVQKLNTENICLKYSESLTADIAKKYIRITNNSGIYIEDTDSNLLGFVSSNDSSLTLINNDYKTMIANNKNFYLQNSVNRGLDVTQSKINSISNFVGNIATNPGNAFGEAIGSAVNTGINYTRSKLNEYFTVDNLKNAPNNIRAAQGNAIFENIYSTSGVYIEEYDVLPFEKEIINDFMDMYGFTYNQVDNIKNCDNIRYYHNYIEADLTNITGISISNVIRDDIKNRFVQGVRFWNTDNIQYTLENYEKWLNE